MFYSLEQCLPTFFKFMALTENYWDKLIHGPKPSAEVQASPKAEGISL